jgi:putative OPT family oligopeptide transporter
LVGGLLEFAQTGLKIIANTFQAWFIKGSTLFGFGGGFSATLIGAGYLIGFNVGISLLFGAVIAWLILVPFLSTLAGVPLPDINSALSTYGEKIHYVGIGAMLVAGFWTLLSLLKPFIDGLNISFQGLRRTDLEKDIPIRYMLLGLLLTLIFLYFLFHHLFNLTALLIPAHLTFPFILGALIYVLIIGFIFAAICGYFSGLVGVSASPGSAVIIAGMLMIALILRALISLQTNTLTQIQLLNAAAITIMIGAVITGSSAIANDNIQDLKVGHLIGSTPWKQQIMLLIGVIAAASVIPPIMETLFNVYGIANVFPHPGMDPSQTLSAPPAAMMAGLAQGVFHHNLPWSMLGLGAGIILFCIICNLFLRRRDLELSILAIAIGMYLPLASSMPLVIGACFSLITKRYFNKKIKNANEKQKTALQNNQQRGWIIACGLVAGAALMDVLLAIPMAVARNPNLLVIMPAHLSGVAILLGILSVGAIGFWLYRVTCRG